MRPPLTQYYNVAEQLCTFMITKCNREEEKHVICEFLGSFNEWKNTCRMKHLTTIYTAINAEHNKWNKIQKEASDQRQTSSDLARPRQTSPDLARPREVLRRFFFHLRGTEEVPRRSARFFPRSWRLLMTDGSTLCIRKALINSWISAANTKFQVDVNGVLLVLHFAIFLKFSDIWSWAYSKILLEYA